MATDFRFPGSAAWRGTAAVAVAVVGMAAGLAAAPAASASQAPATAATAVTAVTPAATKSVGAFAPAETAGAPRTGFSVAVSPRTDLASSGSVRVRLRGVPSHVGLYVRFCAVPRGVVRPSATACLTTSGAWGGVWAVARYPYGTAPTDGSVVNPARQFRVAYLARIGAIDCQTSRCGIFVRRDHRATTDTSYDRFIPLQFAR